MPDTDPNLELGPDDLALLDELARALAAADPVPEQVLAAGQGAFTWLTIDAELAQLAEETVLAGARSTATDRSFTFECDTGAIAFEVTGDGDARRIIGQTDRPAELEIHHRGAPISVATDAHGRFRVDDVLPGPVSVRIVFRDRPETPVVTSWVLV